jgi:hypothetical protein
LLSQLLLDVKAERNRTLGLWTQFRVPATKGNQLFADRTAAVVLALATLGVVHNPFHLVARGQSAVGIAALAGVHQRLDTPSNGLFARLDRIISICALGRAAVVKIESQPFHFVEMALVVVASDAQVEIVTDGAMVSGLNRFLAVVTGIHKLILALKKIISINKYFLIR